MPTTKTSPLPLTADMAAAWHKGLKTEHRTPIKPQPQPDDIYGGINKFGQGIFYSGSDDDKQWTDDSGLRDMPRQPGDIVWIREPGRIADLDGKNVTINYLADDDMIIFDLPERLCGRAWVEKCQGIPNGIFKEACRSWGKVLTVRAERVQDITEEEARAEGCSPIAEHIPGCRDRIIRTARQEFRHLWDSIYAKRGLGWDANPWVWAYKFEKCAKPEGF